MSTGMDRRNRIPPVAAVFGRLGVFQADVAEVVGTSQAQVSDPFWENTALDAPVRRNMPICGEA